MTFPSPIRITTGARLHFGLLRTDAPFGGLGAMVDHPESIIELTPAKHFSADAMLETRSRAIAKRLCQRLGRRDLPAVRIGCLRAAPAHFGFGSGTQTSLAIAEGLCRFLDTPLPDIDLARQIADRGKRSAVGVHGYFQGGLIFENTTDASDETLSESLNPIEARLELPSCWRVVLVRAKHSTPAVSGDREAEQFSRLPSRPDRCERLTALVRNTILPAVESSDFTTFSAALAQYNRESGLLFQTVQGGPYNGADVTELIDLLNRKGARGAGQSSWGPGVFAWCETPEQADALARQIAAPDRVTHVAKPLATGRRLGTDSELPTSR